MRHASEVLHFESSTLAQVDPSGCTVVQGDWVSPYDGLVTTNPGDLQIDHVVALKEAWDSGAWAWNASALVAYGNDLSDSRGLTRCQLDDESLQGRQRSFELVATE